RQERHGRGAAEEELVDPPRRAMDEEQLAVSRAHAPPPGERAQPGLEIRRAVTLGVTVGDLGEVIVARVGVAAVAVLASGGEGLFVVALDREHASLDEE